MRELKRSNNPVYISWITSLLKGSDIEFYRFDNHMSFMEGSISAIEQRIMVHEKDYEAATQLLKQAEKHLNDDT